ncbi:MULTISPECIES: RimK family alpha-L-glutamate ligase [Actinosynnema]|uniref:ATP-grasp domain-containing protein n=1 Tax=Actinosynnema TaxID=40566 RepID=UPI0020A4C55A|nr:RimK family alpha-L-glutamate ligase [Actinosynnema pretiosum]MCP2092325.1 L-2-aminoadipate N-acetyltransferase (EC 2.3.1.-) [Actinosynnema pretiosum]
MGGRVAIIADRVAWEERGLIEVGPAHGLEFTWVNDESLCLGAEDAPALRGFDLALVRSRSYTRGGLIASLAASAGVPVLNGPEAIAACENKLALRALLRARGVPVPDFRLVLSRRDFERATAELPFPLVLKPIFGGMGKRVALLREPDVANSVYDYVEDLGHAFEQACLVEPFVRGGSVRCLVVGREIVATAGFSSGGSDWRNNAAIGSEQTAVEVDPLIAKIVDDVVGALGEGVYGVDLFHDGAGGYTVNEVNHAPGFRAVATTTGVDVATAIARHVREVLG